MNPCNKLLYKMTVYQDLIHLALFKTMVANQSAVQRLKYNKNNKSMQKNKMAKYRTQQR